MDQVSPALQYGLEKVETRSWESSSPHACQSSTESTGLATSLEYQQQTESAAYSVVTLEDNPHSRDSSVEPDSPANLQICKEEEQLSSNEYNCSMALSDDAALIEVADPSSPEVRSKRGYNDSRASAGVYEEGHYPPRIVEVTAVPSSSAAEGQLHGIPQSMQFGTYLPPGKQDKNIVVSLEGAELWHQFYQAGTEMIITKSGRYECIALATVTSLWVHVEYCRCMQVEAKPLVSSNTCRLATV